VLINPDGDEVPRMAGSDIADRMIPTNVCEDMKLPALGEATQRYLTMTEAHDLANTVDERYRA
jgi:hypothetical protein